MWQREQREEGQEIESVTWRSIHGGRYMEVDTWRSKRVLCGCGRNTELRGASVCENDILLVDVMNRIPGQELAVHWRGQPQRETPVMDGVPMVTQCPVPSFTTFQYRFRASQAGTHLWHAHTNVATGQRVYSGISYFPNLCISSLISTRIASPSSGLKTPNVKSHSPMRVSLSAFVTKSPYAIVTHRSQVVEGLYGALVVRRPETTEPLRQLYDVDDSRYLVVFSDWGQAPAAQTLAGPAATLLVNGRAPLQDTEAHKTHLTMFPVRQGLRYRLRMAYTGSYSGCPIVVSVDGHQLQLIALDGSPVAPRLFSSVTLSPGERLDAVLHANQRNASYWLRASTNKKCAHPARDGLAVVRYEGADPVPVVGEISNSVDEPEHPGLHELIGEQRFAMFLASEGFQLACVVEVHIARCRPPSVLLNEKFLAHRGEEAYHERVQVVLSFQNSVDHACRSSSGKKMCLDEIKSATKMSPELSVPKVDTKLYLSYGLKRVHSSAPSLAGAPHMNNISFTYPPHPLISQRGDVKAELLCDESSVSRSCHEGSGVCECVHLISIPLDHTVEILLLHLGECTSLRSKCSDGLCDSPTTRRSLWTVADWHPGPLLFQLLHFSFTTHLCRNPLFPLALPRRLGGVTETIADGIAPTDGAEDEGDHVFHLHGQSFHVVGATQLERPVSLEEAKEKDTEGKLLRRNLVNPVLKDTVSIPHDGVLALRFKASNPGYWLLHVERLSYWMGGLAVVLHVGKDWNLPPLPSEFPTCGSWVLPEMSLMPVCKCAVPTCLLGDKDALVGTRDTSDAMAMSQAPSSVQANLCPKIGFRNLLLIVGLMAISVLIVVLISIVVLIAIAVLTIVLIAIVVLIAFAVLIVVLVAVLITSAVIIAVLIAGPIAIVVLIAIAVLLQC
ncbi:hypothetical protein PR048_026971 [Dryococelus australis]|uniref:Uncharacterized protein n=1 Tax=Dryococelus australis TaxID=614101 RepID=A0ABQ9GMU9_9NEOP|nr:hypothetical protein PR048_026971 [Dryococelus australis]